MEEPAESPERDFLRRLVYTFAQLSSKDMLFIQGVFKGFSIWEASSYAGYSRTTARRRARAISGKHPEFAFLFDETGENLENKQSE